MKSQFLRHCSSGNDGEWPLSDGQGAGRVLWWPDCCLGRVPGHSAGRQEPGEFLGCGDRSVGLWRLKPLRFAGQSARGQRASQRGSTPAEGHSRVLTCGLTSSCMWGNYWRSGGTHLPKGSEFTVPSARTAWPHQPSGRPSRHKALGECTEGPCISRNSDLKRDMAPGLTQF